MKHILVINNLYKPYNIGGAEKSVELLVNNLIESEFDVKIYTLGKKTINVENVFRKKILNVYWPFNNKGK